MVLAELFCLLWLTITLMRPVASQKKKAMNWNMLKSFVELRGTPESDNNCMLGICGLVELVTLQL